MWQARQKMWGMRLVNLETGRRSRLPVTLCLAIWLGGCADAQKHVGGWFGAATPTPTAAPVPEANLGAPTPRVYFASSEGLNLYSEPSMSSKLVGTLTLHEKVTRFKLEHGFAYVESPTSGAKGWVDNSQLIWRLPSKAAPSRPTATEPEESGTEETPVPAATAIEPTATPTSTPSRPAVPSPQTTPRGVAPSIFNPY